MPEVELVSLNRMNVGGKVFENGKRTEVDFETAFALAGNPRFRVYGLDTREALEHRELNNRPRGADLVSAILVAVDRLDVDDDSSFDRVGKPSVTALAGVLGYPVTMEERDLALRSGAKPQILPADDDGEEIKPKPAIKIRKTPVEERKEPL